MFTAMQYFKNIRYWESCIAKIKVIKALKKSIKEWAYAIGKTQSSQRVQVYCNKHGETPPLALAVGGTYQGVIKVKPSMTMKQSAGGSVTACLMKNPKAVGTRF